MVLLAEFLSLLFIHMSDMKSNRFIDHIFKKSKPSKIFNI